MEADRRAMQSHNTQINVQMIDSPSLAHRAHPTRPLVGWVTLLSIIYEAG